MSKREIEKEIDKLEQQRELLNAGIDQEIQRLNTELLFGKDASE